MEVGGWVQVSFRFFFGKSSPNTSKLVQIFWSSIPYICILSVYTLITVVSYYDLSVLFMSVCDGFPKQKFGCGSGWVE